MKPIIAVSFLIIGAALGYLGGTHFGSNTTDEVWDLHFVGLLQDLGNLNSIHEGNIDLVRDQSDISAYAHLLAMRALESERSDPMTVPLQSKIRVLNAMYLEWQARPPFSDQDYENLSGDWVSEWRRGVEENYNYLKWAHEQCQEHPEYDCKASRGRREPAT